MSRRLVVEGDVRLAADVEVPSGVVTRHLAAAPGARIEVGAGCVLETGTAIFSRGVVRLGAGVRCAPHVLIGDPSVAQGQGLDEARDVARLAPRPAGDAAAGVVVGAEDITIEDDVVLGPRAVVAPGTHLGRGSVVFAGTVVAGVVPARSLVKGSPARVEPLPLSPSALKALQARLDAAPLVFDTLCLVGSEAPGRVALRAADREYTYGELLARARGVAQALAARGVGPGSRVLLGCAEKELFIIGFYGTLLAGAASVPLGDGVAKATFDEIAAGSGATLCLTSASSRRVMHDFFDAVAPLELEGLSAAKDPGPAERARPPDSALGMILFTSGTTSKKKAVALPHAAIVQATRNINAFMQLEGDVREYVSVPLSHSMGLGRVRVLFARAATVVVSNGLVNPHVMAEAMRAGRCDALGAVPAVLAMFTGRARPLLEELGARLRYVELGSAPLTPAAKRDLTRVFPRARVCMHYGLTEASRSTFLEFHSDLPHLDTVGRASPNVEVCIMDGDGHVLPPGWDGEIVVRGPHVASAYLGDEVKSAACFRADGFRTGDYGVMDAQGYLKLLGRRDEMINCGGVKISPLELEAKVTQLWPQLDCCIVGVPDPSGVSGEVAALVHTSDSALTVEGVNRELARLVDRPRLPRLVLRVASLPRTESGKLQRGVLKKQLVASGAVKPAS